MYVQTLIERISNYYQYNESDFETFRKIIENTQKVQEERYIKKKKFKLSEKRLTDNN